MRPELGAEFVAMFCIAGLCGAAGHSSREMNSLKGVGARPNFLGW